MSSKQTLTSGVISLISLITISACIPSAQGVNDNITFSYDAKGGQFSRAVAIGASLELEVRDNGNKKLFVREVTIDEPDIFKVVERGESSITLKAIGDGNTMVSVIAQNSSGQTVTDEILMRASKPATIKVTHACADEDELVGYYLKAQEIELPIVALNQDDGELVGVGGDLVELNAELAQLVSLNLSRQTLKLKLGETPGEVELKSAYDANFKRVIKIVEPAQIDDITLEQGDEVVVGSGSFMTVRPAIMGGAICGSTLPLTITTLTPEVCDVATVTERLSEADQPVDPAALGDSGLIDVEGKAAGDCKFTVTYPQGAAGAGASAEFTVKISAP